MRFAVFLCCAFSCFSTEWYASSHASIGSGTKSNPWSLNTALQSPSVSPGDTIWLRGGHYTGGFSSTLNGDSDNYIKIASYPGEWAVLTDGATVNPDILTHSGDYVRFENFEITSLRTNRIVGQGSTPPSGITFANNLSHGNKAINLVIHNVGHPGIGFWKQGAGGEINGCILWGIGIYDNGGSLIRGSGVYAQNESGMATIKNTISFRNFTTGMKVFGETGPVKDFDFNGNIVFACGQASIETASGSSATSNTWVQSNLMLGSPLLSYVSRTNRNQYFINNVLVNGSFGLKEHIDFVVTNNTVMMPAGVGVGTEKISYQSEDFNLSQIGGVWDYNAYFLGDGSSPYNWDLTAADVSSANHLGGGNLKFSNDSGKAWLDWSGWDSHSTYQAGWPTNYLNVTVQPLDYDANRWHICVVSTSAQTSTPINLAPLGFTSGQRWNLRDAQSYFSVIDGGSYAGGTINLPLTLTNVSGIPGVTNFVNKHTNVDQPRLFNAFVLTRQLSHLNLQHLSVERLNLSGVP